MERGKKELGVGGGLALAGTTATGEMNREGLWKASRRRHSCHCKENVPNERKSEGKLHIYTYKF